MTDYDLTARLPGPAGTSVPLLAVVDERLKTTSICFALAHGSRDDPEGRGGIAHLLEHLVMSCPLGGEGPAVSFSEYVERRGGQANALTGLEVMLYYAQMHADDAEDVAAALLRAVFEPVLDSHTLDRERAVVLQELAAAAADPSDVVQDAVLAGLFPGHPLGRPVGGEPGQLAAVTAQELTAVHRDRFVRAPGALVVVGPRVPRVLAEAAVHEAGQPTDPLPRVPPAAKGAEDPLPDPGEANFTWLCFGARSPRADVAGRSAYGVLAHLLGSSPSSLLYRTLRSEHGLSYSFHAWDRGYRESGAWRLLIGTEASAAGRVRTLVDELLTGVAGQGPAPDDFDAALRQAEMSLVLESETPLEYAKLIAERTCSTGRVWSLEDEIAELRRVGVDDVRRAAAHVRRELLLTVRSVAS
ncbi:M16 family metallopeptidase [Streptomyces sp. RPA4-2]|uniref:M16 family metallopeptidase n=1 Tax=Streptomyces sp. RPA4-2 TaxID=2721244 RepID=UPI00143EB1C5|nr:pitrilysin family protein [Streptomyces sp. RPA4-2]QIY61175.1 insulinase family protein [Streptomyces sp. RPA4-2]